MKRAIGAAALLFAMPAYAQSPSAPPPSPHCAGYAPAPSLPDGGRASHAAMTEGAQTVDAWRREREAKMALCLADINALRAQINVLEQSYNQLGAERNNVIATWNGEVAEFSARSAGRERDGVLTRPDH